jgi:hypothetical protein
MERLKKVQKIEKPADFTGDRREFDELVRSGSTSESEVVREFIESAEEEEFKAFDLFLENADKHLELSFDQLEELKILLAKNLQKKQGKEFLKAVERANQILQFQGKDGLLEAMQAKRETRGGSRALVNPALACLLAVFLTVGITEKAFSSTGMGGMSFGEIRRLVVSGKQEGGAEELPFEVVGMKNASNEAWRAVENELRFSRKPIAKIVRRGTGGSEVVYFYYEGASSPAYSWHGGEGDAREIDLRSEDSGGVTAENLEKDGFKGTLDKLKDELLNSPLFENLSENQKNSLKDFFANITSNPQMKLVLDKYTLSSGKSILIPVITYSVGEYEIRSKFFINRTEISARGETKKLGGQNHTRKTISKGESFSDSEILSLINGSDDPGEWD